MKEKFQIDGNASKPRISKMHNVQETQKAVSKQTGKGVLFLVFLHFGRPCIQILVQAIDTL